jgi:hypothetical protein
MKAVSVARSTFGRLDPLVWAALGLILLYLAWAALLPHGYFETVDEGGKVLYIENTLRTGNPAAPFLYPGRSFDQQGMFFPTWWRLQRGTEFYTWWQPGFPLLTLPFYVLFGWFGLYLIPALAGGAAAYFSGVLLRQLMPVSDRLAVLCTLVVGLATPVMFYSANFHEHTLATALVLASMAAVLRSRQTGSPRMAAAAGALASLAVFFRTEVVTLLFGMGVVLLIADWKMGLRFGAAFALVALPWMGLNYLITGYPINHHLSEVVTLADRSGLAALGKRLIPAILFGQPGTGALAPTRTFLLLASTFTLAGLGMFALKPFRPFAPLAFLAAGLTCSWILLSPVGYRSVHGLVTVAPQILFAGALLAAGSLWKKSLFPWMLLAGGAVFAIVYLMKAWSSAGGIQWGPRYLLSFYPLLVVGALAALHAQWPGLKMVARLAVCAGFAICALVGMGFEARGWFTNYTVLSLYRQSEPALREMSDAPMVTYYCDPPLHIPELYWEQTFLSTSRAGQDAWPSAVNKLGVTRYYRLDSWDLCSAAPFDQMIKGRETNPSGITFTEIKQ